eukprot:TRINITY_DN1548_c4_g1_i1.p1 TRINITY_DN1548_c4_g1~~TRINITY_DN1548_c4_g1_i1.p1  ORF type:complete len:508 (+),score=50.48 TRINITY_DN1548_c4_g1_i1:48-1526(+)
MSKQGIQWPETNGKVSTMATGKEIWKAAAAKSGDETLAGRIAGEKNWRNGYPKHCVSLAEEQTKSVEIATASARAGLEEAYNRFLFVRNDTTCKITELSTIEIDTPFTTTEVKGTGETTQKIEVPLNGKTLTDETLASTTKGWADFGSMEESCHKAIKEIVEMTTSQRSDILKDKIFVLLGATSAAGPAIPLLKLGATVAMIARPGKKLQTLIEEGKSTSGTMLIPTSGEKQGADVLTQTPEIIEWCRSLDASKTLVIGSYIYLDGEAHVRASIASDVITQSVFETRRSTCVAFLGSPSIAHAFSEDAHTDSIARYESSGLLSKCNPMRVFKYEKNSRPVKYNIPVTDGLVVFQGPNYALAKTLQSWRAVLCKVEGRFASINLAPPMYTESICHVPAAMAALNGFQGFPPLAAFQPETMSPVLTCMLLWDLVSPSSTAQPETALDSPTQIFVQNAFHGGSWRCAYSQESIGSSIFILGKCWYTKPPLTPPSM